MYAESVNLDFLEPRFVPFVTLMHKVQNIATAL